MKEFVKEILFANLYHLIKQSGKRIRDLEEEAGVSIGYISRMNKESNGKPGIDFIVKAADLLNVSIDTLLSVDLTKLTGTQQYALSFLEKLIKSTVEEKLAWEKEPADELNNVDIDYRGVPEHPLFSEETFSESDYDNDFSEKDKHIVFNSKTFGLDTVISGDCFKMELKYSTYLYLMDIERGYNPFGESNEYAKEVWLYTPSASKQFLCSDKDLHLGQTVITLFRAVTEYSKHPQLKIDFRKAIDAFMEEDYNDENNNSDTVPFDEEVPF